MIPADEQLLAVAEHAVALTRGEAQATAWWERRAGHEDTAGIEVVLVRGGTATTGRADGFDEAAARHAVERLDGPEPATGLPGPSGIARTHQGFDPAVLRGTSPDAAASGGATVDVRAAKVAIVSSRGIRAVERRSVVRAEAVAERDGRVVRATGIAPGLAGVDLETLREEAQAALGAAPPAEAPSGEPAVVLGPAAVAAVLDALRPRFAAGGERLAQGTRVAASCIALAESPRFAGTLPRSLDAEGVPRQPVPLLQDGVAHRLVSDSASGSSTGHATLPARPAPRAEHLVLVGGGAADVTELASPVGDGVFVGAIELDGTGAAHGRGLFAIEGGRLGAALADAVIELAPLDVLAATQALTMRQRAVPYGGPDARTAAATVCPALRATAGVRFA